jgi:hypothetical protein
VAVLRDPLPWSDKITSYDEAHFVTYLRLLDAEAAGTSNDEMCRVILELDPVGEPEKARRVLKDHLRRAKWMTNTGYKVLLQDA